MVDDAAFGGSDSEGGDGNRPGSGPRSDSASGPTLTALETESGPAFHAPWQARAFAVAVALSDDGTYEWNAFQERLADEIDRVDGPAVPTGETAAEDDYYRRWLAALERLLVADGVLESGELTDRTREFADGERNASEWVDGKRGHDDDHAQSHGVHGHEHGVHGHGSGHDHSHDHGLDSEYEPDGRHH